MFSYKACFYLPLALFAQVWDDATDHYTGDQLCRFDEMHESRNHSVYVKQIVHGEYGLCYQINVTQIIGKVVHPGESKEYHY